MLVLLSLVVRLVYRIIDTEDVIWVEGFFEALQSGLVKRGGRFVHESLSQFANSVVMGDGASEIHHSFS